MREVGIHSKTGISNSTLKLIAITAMLIDHIGAVILEPIIIQSYRDGGMMSGNLLQINNFMRLFIGRVAFPIFCFLLVEGFTRTRNVWKYAARLLIFAVISEVPFDLALRQRVFDAGYQNVFFTLFIGLFVIILADLAAKIFGRTAPAVLLGLPAVALGMYLAKLLRTDYAAYGVLCITVLYFFRTSRRGQILAGTVAFIVGDIIINGGTSELLAPLGFIAVACYNGERGLRMKYLFYVFYPLHLLILSGIRIFLL